MKLRATGLSLLVVGVLAGCGGGSDPTSTVAASVPTAVSSPSPSPAPRPKPASPHFATPEAAMRYLASAWNRNNIVELKHVTDPNARAELEAMHSEAADLRLNHCTKNKVRGDYECFFDHGFPKGYKSKGPVGSAEFTVGQARRPGWYMTVFVACGG
jgi:hypothetical protein